MDESGGGTRRPTAELKVWRRFHHTEPRRETTQRSRQRDLLLVIFFTRYGACNRCTPLAGDVAAWWTRAQEEGSGFDPDDLVLSVGALPELDALRAWIAGPPGERIERLYQAPRSLWGMRRSAWDVNFEGDFVLEVRLRAVKSTLRTRRSASSAFALNLNQDTDAFRFSPNRPPNGRSACDTVLEIYPGEATPALKEVQESTENNTLRKEQEEDISSDEASLIKERGCDDFPNARAVLPRSGFKTTCVRILNRNTHNFVEKGSEKASERSEDACVQEGLSLASCAFPVDLWSGVAHEIVFVFTEAQVRVRIFAVTDVASSCAGQRDAGSRAFAPPPEPEKVLAWHRGDTFLGSDSFPDTIPFGFESGEHDSLEWLKVQARNLT